MLVALTLNAETRKSSAPKKPTKLQQRAQLQRNDVIPHDTPAPGVEPSPTSPDCVDAALILVGLQSHEEVDSSTHTQLEQRPEDLEIPPGGRGQRTKRPSLRKLAASEAIATRPKSTIPAPVDDNPEPPAIKIHSDASNHTERNTPQPNSSAKRPAGADASSPLRKLLRKELDSNSDESLRYQLILQTTLDASNT